MARKTPKRVHKPDSDGGHVDEPPAKKPCLGKKGNGCRHNGSVRRIGTTDKYIKVCDLCRGPAYASSKKPPKAAEQDKTAKKSAADDSTSALGQIMALPMPWWVPTDHVTRIRNFCEANGRPEMASFTNGFAHDLRRPGEFIASATQRARFQEGITAFSGALTRGAFGDPQKAYYRLRGDVKGGGALPAQKGLLEIPRLPGHEETEEGQRARQLFNHQFNGIPPPVRLENSSILARRICVLRKRCLDSTSDYTAILSRASNFAIDKWLQDVRKTVPERLRPHVTLELLVELYVQVTKLDSPDPQPAASTELAQVEGPQKDINMQDAEAPAAHSHGLGMEEEIDMQDVQAPGMEEVFRHIFEAVRRREATYR